MTWNTFSRQLRLTSFRNPDWHSMVRTIAAVFSAMLPIASAIAATSEGGTLRGVIFDPNGAVISGASVILTNWENSEQIYSFSGSEGEYRFDELKPGSYRLKISSRGFDTREVNITVRANDDTRLDQTLSIAPVTAEVTVEAPEPFTTVFSCGVGHETASDPLVKAAMEDDLDALRTVLLTRSDPTEQNKQALATALKHAVQNSNREMVQTLLSAKVDVNARDSQGQTVLMLLNEKVTSEIVWDLINAGAKVNLRDEDGDSALISVAEENNVDALKSLLDAGAKVDATNNDGETALMIAAEKGLVNNVRLLILAGADVNVRNKEKKTALMYATENNETAVARLLKAHGAIEFEEPRKQ